MIDTKYGKLEGIEHETYMEYRGIPFAKPPVGDLRWKAPQPQEPWSGVYQAVHFQGKCMQWDADSDELADIDYFQEFHSDSSFECEASEDCLYLNIWTPKSGKKNLPVAFWIHGGAFMGGAGSEMEFDGKAYCDREVILVSIQYRCNVFGFFAHPWLDEENENHISGNYGILDQIAALRWVYENIEVFGGDKKNITVFGQSAGAMSTQTLISSELTENMIAKAIMQSGGSYGSGLHKNMPLSRQEELGIMLTDMLGVDSLEELRKLPADEIVSHMAEYDKKIKAIESDLYWVPTTDGYVMNKSYYELMDEGRIKDIPYMLGTTKDDILVTKEMQENKTFSPLYKGVEAFGRKLCEMKRTPAYLYYFTHELPGNDYGAFHSAELWYMFGTLNRSWRPMESHDQELSRELLDYWTNFMKTGDPNSDGLAVWEPYRCENPVIKRLE